ncbi:glycoside hydrolase family 128 protein, partial [Atractiella rhizophila]
TGKQFIPMIWNDAPPLAEWQANVEKAIAAGATHLLAFNEPDLAEQANMDVDRAVTAWRKYMQPYAGRVKLVSPAVTNGGPPTGKDWLDRFLAACTGCTIDVIAFHIYDQAWNVGYFQGYINDTVTHYAPRKCWMTEWAGWGATPADTTTFLNTMIPWLEDLPGLERYAYFGAFKGILLDDNGNLNQGGQTYNSLN